MKNLDLFASEIAEIKNEKNKQFLEFYFDNYVPSYFWEIGASSTGKYHPKYSQGQGGLARHSKCVAMIAIDLMRMEKFSFDDEDADLIIVACLAHDTAKYGRNEFDKNAFKVHGETACDMLAEAWEKFFGEEAPSVLTMSVASHMGQWGNMEIQDRAGELVHFADYISSRKFLENPQCTSDYEDVFCPLPF